MIEEKIMLALRNKAKDHLIEITQFTHSEGASSDEILAYLMTYITIMTNKGLETISELTNLSYKDARQKHIDHLNLYPAPKKEAKNG